MNSKYMKLSALILLFINLHLLSSCDSGTPTEPIGLIETDSTSVSFTSVLYGPLPSAKSFIITNGSGGTLNWSLSSDVSWVSLSPISGNSNNSTVIVSADTTGLSLGQHNAIITISSTNAGNSPQVIDVSYTINVVSLSGTYDGTYRVITGYNTPSADTSESAIEMRFSDESYWFDSENSPDNFCSPRGSYILSNYSNNIEITENQSGCNVTADGRDSPRGIFSYRIPGDSLIMLQLSSDTLKHIQLLRR